MTTVACCRLPDVAEHYRRRFRHVLVDEYQDTNHAQYVLVRELVGHRGGRPGPPARRAVRRRRRRPVDLRLPRRDDPQHPRVRARLPGRRRSCSSRTTARPRPSCRPPTRSSPQPGRKPKRLWTDAGDGEPIVGYVADNEHDEARSSRRRSTLSDEGEVKPGRRGLLPHQRPVAVARGGLHPGRPAVQGRRRRAVLRAQGDPRRARLPAGARQPRRRRLLRRILNTPKRGIGDRAEACRGAGRARAHPVRRRAATAPRTRRARDPLAGAIEAFVTAGTTCARWSRRARGPRRARGGARADRLPRRAARPAGPAGRDAGGEPRRARGGRPASSRRRTPTGTSLDFLERSRWWPTPTRSPTPTGRARRRRDPDDAAHGQGPGVPGRVPHRAGGRRLPAHARAGRPEGAGGGAPAGLRRDHPGPASGSTCRGPCPLGLGRAVVQPAVAVPRRGARGAARVGAGGVVGDVEAAGGAAWPPGRPRARRATADRRAASRGPGHPRHVRARHRGVDGGLGDKAEATIDFGTSTASSACCCATPRSRSSKRAPTR
jgi:hypothetical protein